MFDINEPVTNPTLINAIEAIQKEVNQSTRDDFLNAVKEAKFLSPVSMDPPPPPGDDGKTTLQADTKISFISLTDANGDSYLPVYTDWPALKQWRDIPDEKTLILSYEDVKEMIVNNAGSSGFVINPFSQNVPVSKNIMEALDAGPVRPWTVKKDTQVRIGQPANDPIAIKEAISAYLKDVEDVRSAYLVLMEKEEELSFLIVVDFAGDRQTIFSGIASVAVPLLREGELIDMVPADSDLGRSVVRDFLPFYEQNAE